jgi:hypothetical protein
MNTTQPEIYKATTDKDTNKFKKLGLSLLFDAIGMASFTIPFIGEFSDIVWAPISAILIYKMYKGTEGRIGGMVSFFEELIPGLDFIPTFTLTWIYKYIIKKQK